MVFGLRCQGSSTKLDESVNNLNITQLGKNWRFILMSKICLSVYKSLEKIKIDQVENLSWPY